MRKFSSKIAILFLISILYSACSSTKKVGENEQLLTKNILNINDTIIESEKIESLLYQKPNSSVLGFPLRLNMYNLAKDNPDSAYYNWLDRKPNRRKNLAKILSDKQVDRLSQSFLVSGLSRTLKNLGEEPVIIDNKKSLEIEKQIKRLLYLY